VPASHTIRTFGDPVLRKPCPPVVEIDDRVRQLAEDMISTMYNYRGVGVAAPQVGVSRSMFVFDDGNGAEVVINPRITSTSGEWEYEEGCLSVPNQFFPIIRPDHVVMEGLDIDGNERTWEGNELTGRIFLHEVDHLDGKLLLTRLTPEQKKQAMSKLRNSK
jgi:peptide deformylase